jgi:DNA polymerase III gamma/tau subunit
MHDDSAGIINGLWALYYGTYAADRSLPNSAWGHLAYRNAGTSFDNFRKLTEFICEKNSIEAIRLLDELFNNSVDPGSLMNKYADYLADLITRRLIDKNSVPFDGKKMMIIADCVTDILKDFKILQNIKLISKINVLKAMSKINAIL